MSTYSGKISFVIPCFNEEGNIESLCNEIIKYSTPITPDYEIILIDDGSKDGTFEKIKSLNSENRNIHGISFSKNFGHQIALYAGIQKSTGGIIIMMDGDHQHPPSLISVLFEKFLEGFDIVNTRRLNPNEKKLSFKRLTSKFYYYIINKLSDVYVEPDSADFRLITRQVADAFLKLEERDRFTRGLVRWMGYSQTLVDYNVRERKSGITKYTFRRMLSLALDGVTSMSSKPLRISFYLGLVIFLSGFFYSIYAVIRHLAGNTIEGWTSILISVLIIGGVQLLILSIIGEYIGRIFTEIKKRPMYYVKDEV